MSEDLSVTFTSTLDDMVAFNKYHFANSPSSRRARAMTIWGFAATLVLMMGIMSAIEGTYFHVICGTIIAAAYIPYARWRYQVSLRKTVERLYMEGVSKGSPRSHTIRILDDGILETTAVGDYKTLWAGVERVVQDSGYIYIYVGPVQAHVIPVNRIEAGDLPAFVSRLNQEMRKRSAG